MKTELKELIEAIKEYRSFQSIGNEAKMNCAIEKAEKALSLADVVKSVCKHPEASRQHNPDDEPDRCEDCGELFH